MATIEMDVDIWKGVIYYAQEIRASVCAFHPSTVIVRFNLELFKISASGGRA